MTLPRLRRLRSGTLAVVRLRWTRRRLAAWLARQLRRLERRLEPLPRDRERAASIARHPSRSGVVPDDPPSIASGRADLQLVHDAVARDLTARARALADRARDDWNRLVENSWHDTGPQGEA